MINEASFNNTNFKDEVEQIEIELEDLEKSLKKNKLGDA